jgi:LysM repeat protein
VAAASICLCVTLATVGGVLGLFDETSTPSGRSQVPAATELTDITRTSPTETKVVREPTRTTSPSATAHATDTPAVTPFPTPTPTPVTYTTKAGDNLTKIAKSFGTTAAAIAEANDIEDPSRIRVGQVLVIPVTGSLSATHSPPMTTAALPTVSTPGLSWEERRYAMQMSAITEEYAGAFFNLGTLSGMAADNPLLIANVDWQLAIATQSAVLTLNGKKVREIDPPSRVADVHTQLVAASRQIDSSAYLLNEGIQEPNLTKIELAAEAMQVGVEYLLEAKEKLEEFQAP